jgi:hypothetical protein
MSYSDIPGGERTGENFPYLDFVELIVRQFK